jgi:hypothetical protein
MAGMQNIKEISNGTMLGRSASHRLASFLHKTLKPLFRFAGYCRSKIKSMFFQLQNNISDLNNLLW